MWHVSRAYCLTAALSALLVFFVRSVLLRRGGRVKLSHTPLAITPVEKDSWLNDTIRPRSDPNTAQDASIFTETSTRRDKSNDSPFRPRLDPKRVKGSRVKKIPRNPVTVANETTIQESRFQPLIFFSSLTGTTESYARQLMTKLQPKSSEQPSTILEPHLHDLSYIDYDDFFITLPKPEDSSITIHYFYIFLIPTYNIDSVLNTFLEHLQETHNDFRIDTAPLSNLLGYSVFGFGDKEGWPSEEEGFCSQAKEVDKWMAKLSGRKRAFPLGMGDVKSDVVERFAEWSVGMEEALDFIIKVGGLGEGVPGSGNAMESDEEDIAEDEEPISGLNPGAIKLQESLNRRKRDKISNVDDLEDLGNRASSEATSADFASESTFPLAIDFTTSTTTSKAPPALKAMVPTTSPTYTALTKQGYSIIGTHSGVKICRWTKSALRGRGSCYKHSFYGIASHLCMETTPSLSCSNKCVFCWRHGTNPVGTTWRWQVDRPELIFQGAKAAHLKKIKMMRGVPGVRAERFQEAMKIRHCALSLVGEPIFYPHINAFLALLHAEHISSFLVCNAQHPDQLAALGPVTQLYVSIDASNRESLRKIDRPLHRDFWERFNRCLDILREKRFAMRTVFRLTLVKGFNIADEVAGYADLVEKGLPCFVEIKGVTYCGTSSSAGAGLTMQNVPFYSEVVEFVEALNAVLEERGLGYGIAAEHAHSCCVLLASERFRVNGKWHTLIDYEKFFECLESGKSFKPEDYMGAETPEWATWGRGGFDPRDERVDRKGRKIEAA